MRSFAILGAAALVAASPAPSGFNFAAVETAAAPAFTGPAFAAASQSGVYNAAAASDNAAAAASAVATATGTSPDVNARALQGRTFCFFGFGPFCGSKTTSYAQPAKTTTAAPYYGGGGGGGGAAASTTTAAVTTAPATTSTPINVVPSTCTPISWTNTFAFTSDTACPTPYEVGTFCGFINPEDPCSPQPDGYGPVSSPDTVDAFESNSALHKMATSAADPKGYTSTFKDLNAAVNANSYMGFKTLKSYDVNTCAQYCDSTDLCTGFNIYIERDPKWNPDKCSCNNPDSITNYKCSIWGSGVEAGAATNTGEGRDAFQIVITGSNGYEKTNTTIPATPAGCSKPQKCGAVHDHPNTCIGEHFFPGPFDAGLCAKYAIAQNLTNKASGIWAMFLSFWGYNPGQCKFFNAFLIKKDAVAKGTYCKLFAQEYDSRYASFIPGWSGGHYFGVESSWSWSVSV